MVVQVDFHLEKVTLKISDNGQGFEIPDTFGDFTSSGKWGLMGMQERAGLIGAVLTMQSESGEGTTLMLEVAQ